MSEPTDIVPARSVNWFVPASLQDAMLLAQTLAKAGDLVPRDYRGSPERILLAIQYGAELGLTPMASLQTISVINGRTTLWGDGLLAVCQGHPLWAGHKEYFTGTPGADDWTAVCEVYRRGEEKPHSCEFSVGQAKRAKLWQKDTYQSYPRRMLMMRARGFALRDAFSDALRGVISREEAEDYPSEKPAKYEVVDGPVNSVESVKQKLGIVPSNRPPPDESDSNPLELPTEKPVEKPARAKGKPAPKDLPPSKGQECIDLASAAGIHLEDVYREAQNISGTTITSSRDLLALSLQDHERLLVSLKQLAGVR